MKYTAMLCPVGSIRSTTDFNGEATTPAPWSHLLKSFPKRSFEEIPTDAELTELYADITTEVTAVAKARDFKDEQIVIEHIELCLFRSGAEPTDEEFSDFCAGMGSIDLIEARFMFDDRHVNTLATR